MPRRKGSRVSISSDQLNNCNQNETLNITDELPDPGLPRANPKDPKDKKRVSFNFPVEVITKNGKFTGMGTIDLVESSSPDEGSRSEGDQYKISYDLTQNATKIKDQIKQKGVNVQGTNSTSKKVQEPVIDLEAPTKVDLTKDKEPSGKPATAVESRQNNKEVAATKTTIKAAREAKKKEAETLREATKKAKEDEKRAKAQHEEFNKVYKPGECLKYITVVIHPELSSAWYARELVQVVTEAGVEMRAGTGNPSVITWTRGSTRCSRALYVLPAQRAIEPGLGMLLAKLHDELAGPLTVVVFGVRQIISMLPMNGSPQMTQEKFTKAINELQMELIVERRIDVVAAEAPSELALLVMHYTRAVAEAPYKKAKRDIDEQAEFYMRGDNKNCVTVDKHGNGLRRLWEQMIAVLPMSSLEIARSLGAQYKTPKALLQEFQTAGGIAKVANIGVTRDNAPEAKTRRLGPEFARKLHILFTTEDGNTVIE